MFLKTFSTNSWPAFIKVWPFFHYTDIGLVS
nr:MAG TPA: hypothetical protein [Caudoviricetes sp.]